MKHLLILIAFFSLYHIADAQTQVKSNTISTTVPKLPSLDQSPMDMAYYPADYPVLKIQNKASTPLVARIIYGRPQASGRKIFGELVSYGKVWRLGANEATEIEFFRDVVIDGKKVAKGRYTLFAIPEESKWTMIINKDTDTWGAFIYDQSKDVVRTEVLVKDLDTAVEPLSMVFQKSAKGADLVIAWENKTVTLPVEFK